ncbi:hypothetical protein BKA67DRAFT_537705 [Truncatella angustata]|uniref:Uncharacterized protein n=1 Tax=Truncatella angustata TaxID=152316 RepID=A0A9P8ZVB0_9PEZI|nr:uncharacterized protein BKA67DRAFT_537705 [Truncatella angustata]KAH6651855.1 hypothetical protein BKA67DRAFT_537705 [Truncatella angustata]KAH8198997.1 hypothetical protein TruAng_006826 [Truncatella angustata]
MSQPTAIIQGNQDFIDIEDDTEIFPMEEEHQVEIHKTTFAYFAGDLTSAALFVEVQGQLSRLELINVPKDSLGRLEDVLRKKHFRTADLVACLSSYMARTHIVKSLVALAIAAKIYTNVLEATVSMEVTRSSLYAMSWVPLGQEPMTQVGFAPFQMDWVHLFACIIQFELGPQSVNLADFERVMAVSVGD